MSRSRQCSTLLVGDGVENIDLAALDGGPAIARASFDPPQLPWSGRRPTAAKRPSVVVPLRFGPRNCGQSPATAAGTKRNHTSTAKPALLMFALTMTRRVNVFRPFFGLPTNFGRCPSASVHSLCKRQSLISSSILLRRQPARVDLNGQTALIRPWRPDYHLGPAQSWWNVEKPRKTGLRGNFPRSFTCRCRLPA